MKLDRLERLLIKWTNWWLNEKDPDKKEFYKRQAHKLGVVMIESQQRMNDRLYARESIDVGNHPICHLCMKKIMTQEEFSLDHLTPKSKGGKKILSNLKPAHKVCNNKRGNMDLREWFERVRQ